MSVCRVVEVVGEKCRDRGRRSKTVESVNDAMKLLGLVLRRALYETGQMSNPSLAWKKLMF